MIWNGPRPDPHSNAITCPGLGCHCSHCGPLIPGTPNSPPMKQTWWARLVRLGLLAVCTCTWLVQGCGPGPGYGIRSRPRKLVAMHYKQFVPNFSESNLGASGRAEGKITRNSERFNELVCNYNTDIVFKDEENTNADRFMTKRCKECLNRLAIAVMNQWPGVHLRVTEAWDEDGHHPPDSLHYEGRAVDITTDDRKTEKYGLLAQLAVEAGFDWVHYESKYHVHCSVKADHAVTVEKGGCFPGWARVSIAGGGQKTLLSLSPGDRVMALSGTGRIVFSKVLLFLHRDQESRSTFLILETEDGHRLALTPHHLLFLAHHYKLHYSEYQVQFASKAQRGDYVLIHGSGGQVQPSKINSVSVEEDVGVYAPLTEDGTLFVDGVLVSSYALIEDHILAHWAFGPLRLLSSVNQILWGESAEEWQSIEAETHTETPSQSSTWVLGKVGLYVNNNTSNNRGNLTLSRTMDIEVTHSLQRRVSTVHWYARLLYSFACIFLDLK
ncbi:desert hedgehog protein [Lampris incognitus]|uniref:desert hedgehog protein n=1 Tax=Lampris incognitus TaxID=2546036 RepID=UPI0024B4F44D|nr:desert hedgehog protein [Lampris incognitus]